MSELDTKFRVTQSNLRSRLDISPLLTTEAFEREREQIFRRSWLLVGHADDVPKAGSYVVEEIPTFKTSIIMMRGNDDKVRVFYNACRHRGNKLVREGSGCKSNFMCAFHGWVFTPEGNLRVVTDEQQFEPLDKSEWGLIPITTEVWEGLVFVNFDKQPDQTLAEWLGEMHGQYNGYFDQHELVGYNRITVKCNWHLAVNSFTEGYHTLYLHKNTARDYQGGRGNTQRHRPWLELFNLHHRFSAPGNPDHLVLDVEGLAIKYGRKQLPAFDFDMTGMPPGINPSRFEHWGFDNISIFPNTVMLHGNHWHIEMTFWPIDFETTLIMNRAYNYKTKNLGERLSQAYYRSRGRDVVREDLNTLEAQHAMLASGSIPEIVLSKQEMAIQQHYRVTDEMLRRADNMRQTAHEAA